MGQSEWPRQVESALLPISARQKSFPAHACSAGCSAPRPPSEAALCEQGRILRSSIRSSSDSDEESVDGPMQTDASVGVRRCTQLPDASNAYARTHTLISAAHPFPGLAPFLPGDVHPQDDNDTDDDNDTAAVQAAAVAATAPNAPQVPTLDSTSDARNPRSRERGPSHKEFVRVAFPATEYEHGERVIAKVIGAAVAQKINSSTVVRSKAHNRKRVDVIPGRAARRGIGGKKKSKRVTVITDEWIVVSGDKQGGGQWSVTIRFPTPCVAVVSAPKHLHSQLVRIKVYPGARPARTSFGAHDPRGVPDLDWVQWRDYNTVGTGTVNKRISGVFTGAAAVHHLQEHQVSPASQDYRPSLKRKRGRQPKKGLRKSVGTAESTEPTALGATDTPPQQPAPPAQPAQPAPPAPADPADPAAPPAPPSPPVPDTTAASKKKKKQRQRRTKATRQFARQGPPSPPARDRHSTDFTWDGTLLAPSPWPLDLSMLDTTVAESIEVPFQAALTQVRMLFPSWCFMRSMMLRLSRLWVCADSCLRFTAHSCEVGF
jgi:hypothetical protein